MSVYVTIKALPPAATSRFDLFVTTGTLEHSVPQGSVAQPAESPWVLAVGATCWQVGNAIRPYSSQGPTIDGRIKPDLAAYDGVSTKTFGLASTCNGGFLGTSAATPEVAGAAALVLQQQPGLMGNPGGADRGPRVGHGARRDTRAETTSSAGGGCASPPAPRSLRRPRRLRRLRRLLLRRSRSR